MKNKIVLLISVLLLCSCSQKPEEGVQIVKLNGIEDIDCVSLVSEPFVLQDTAVVVHSDIWVDESFFIVKSKNDNGFLRFYSLEDGTLLNSYGRIGRGPEEYLYPNVFKNNKGEYVISDRTKFSVIKTEELFTDSKYKAQHYSVDKGLFAINFFTFLPEERMIVYNSGSDECQLTFVNLDTNEPIEYKRFPTVSKVEIPSFIANTNVYLSSMTKEGEYIYAAYNSYPIVDKISIADKSVVRSMLPILPEYNKVVILDDLNATVDNRLICNMDIDVVNGNVYTLYFGKTEEDLSNNGPSNPQILKYNKKGELINRYELDRIASKFCIDAKEENAYIVSYNEDFESMIYKIKLR